MTLQIDRSGQNGSLSWLTVDKVEISFPNVARQGNVVASGAIRELRQDDCSVFQVVASVLPNGYGSIT